ncbi:ribosomal protein S18-alanine N-acetyltransferase [Aliidiomarina indica]|uniref:ribosomal protein S18-alanine N-acetyltransferase n=1 Tax=Aliidiomarina indica TaxID=2749147 RepID=UPI00188EADDF|nr:ribosomal protein S18-alanine N-acetyltransferase [Aliidiomarina indica]
MALVIAPIHGLSPDMMTIERAAHRVPWGANVFGNSFGPRYRVMGLFLHDRLVGYTVSHVLFDEIMLMNIAVAPAHHRKGYGQLLMDDLIAFASDEQGQQKDMLFLEVREHNESAIRLYERNGFKEIGRRPGYYPPVVPGDERETAIVMSRTTS